MAADEALSRHLRESPQVTIHVFDDAQDPMVVVRSRSGIPIDYLSPRGPIMSLVRSTVGRGSVVAATRDPNSIVFCRRSGLDEPESHVDAMKRIGPPRGAP